MHQLLGRLWHDDAGFIFSVELMLVFVILLLGIIAGLTALRSAVVVELYETGQAILSLNQSYTISGITGCCGSAGGSSPVDTVGTLGVPTCVTAATNSIDVTAPCAP